MKIEIKYRKYVVLQFQSIEDMLHLGFVQDFDDLPAANQFIDERGGRKEGMLVFAVPEESRLPDGSNYVFDSEKFMAEREKPQPQRIRRI